MPTIKLAHGITYAIDAENDTIDPDEGSVRLVGFQEGSVQRVKVFASDWRAAPDSALGLCPVFSRGEGGMFAVVLPVVEVLA